MIRDALMTGLARDGGLVTQAYRPVVVYLNGQYWGIHNPRERLDESYLSSHYGVDRDNLDLLEDSKPAQARDQSFSLVLLRK